MIFLADNVNLCPLIVPFHWLSHLKQLMGQAILYQRRFERLLKLQVTIKLIDMMTFLSMIKTCGWSIIKLLQLLFNNCVKQRVFYNIWKMFFQCTKNIKQLVDNYRPISLLPICSKILEKLLFDSIYEFLDKNSLLNSSQSEFRTNYFSIHQFIAITHDVNTAFDANPSLV